MTASNHRHPSRASAPGQTTLILLWGPIARALHLRLLHDTLLRHVTGKITFLHLNAATPEQTVRQDLEYADVIVLAGTGNDKPAWLEHCHLLQGRESPLCFAFGISDRTLPVITQAGFPVMLLDQTQHIMEAAEAALDEMTASLLALLLPCLVPGFNSVDPMHVRAFLQSGKQVHVLRNIITEDKNLLLPTPTAVAQLKQAREVLLFIRAGFDVGLDVFRLADTLEALLGDNSTSLVSVQIDTTLPDTARQGTLLVVR